MAEISAIPPIWTKVDVIALLDHVLAKPTAMVVRNRGDGYYEAIYGKGMNQAGKRFGELTTVPGALINDVFTNGLTAARTLYEKVTLQGSFDMDIEAVIPAKTILDCLGAKITTSEIIKCFSSVSNDIIVIGGRWISDPSGSPQRWPLYFESDNVKILYGDYEGWYHGPEFASGKHNKVLFIHSKESWGSNLTILSSGTEVVGCVLLDGLEDNLHAFGENCTYALNRITNVTPNTIAVGLKGEMNNFYFNEISGATTLLAIYALGVNYRYAKIIGNTFKNGTVGILENGEFGGVVDYNKIYLNQFFDVTTPHQKLNNAGPNTKARFNYGYITELLLTGKTVNLSQTTIPHGLGVIPNNIQIIPTSDGRIWRSAASDGVNIYLTADADGRTCDIYVSRE